MEQLKRWQKMGYFVSLDVVSEGKWVLVVGTEPIHDFQARGGYDLGLRREVLRFVSLPFDTPEEAIARAVEVVR